MKEERIARWARRKARHRKDGNHIPGGFQCGNPRYGKRGCRELTDLTLKGTRAADRRALRREFAAE